MNAVQLLVEGLARSTLIRLADDPNASELTPEILVTNVVRRYELRLLRFLNELLTDELTEIAQSRGIELQPHFHLRQTIWLWAHRCEGGKQTCPPDVVSGKLVVFKEGPGTMPESVGWPRSVASTTAPRCRLPQTVDELLSNATALIGAAFPPQGTNKGAFGIAVATALGLREDNASEPDWMGEIEVKTIPVRKKNGLWTVKEDPAITMDSGSPYHKLQRVLWIARTTEEPATVLSWFLQSLEPEVKQLAERYLHLRPKGGAGTNRFGWYMHKRFFTECGFLYSLNGNPKDR